MIIEAIKRRINKFNEEIQAIEGEVSKLNDELSFLNERLSFAQNKLSKHRVNVFHIKDSLAQKETVNSGIEKIQEQIEAKNSDMEEKNKALRSIRKRKDVFLSVEHFFEYVSNLPKAVTYSVTTVIVLAFVLLAMRIAFPPHEHVWVEPTCDTAKYCSECGAIDGEPLGHIWVEATCTEPKTCSRCKATYGAPNGHEWQEATCTLPKSCTVCGFVDHDPLGHDVKEYIVEVEPTCGSQGIQNGICIRCGETISVELPATGNHLYGKGMIDKEPTCSETGIESVECQICGYKTTRTLPKLPHEDDNIWVVYYEGVRNTHCKVCGQVLQTGELDYNDKSVESLKEILSTVKCTITFGHDNHYPYEDEGAPLEWIVAKTDGGKALIISKHIIGSSSFSKDLTKQSWKSSAIRSYLNGGFYEYCFSSQEKKAILSTAITDEGYTTYDYVFLISKEDLGKYSASKWLRIASPTSYAKEHYKGEWWIMDTYINGVSRSTVNGKGEDDWLTVNESGGIRPVMWIDINTMATLLSEDA